MNQAPGLSHANWVKSSYSNGQGGACVECAAGPRGIIAVRDSENPQGPKLTFTPAQWQAFTNAVKSSRDGAGLTGA